MGILVLFAVMLAAAVLAARAPLAALLTTIFLASWNGLIIDIGLQLTAYQMFLLPLAGVTLLRALLPGWRSSSIAAGGWLLAFVLYGVIWSMLMMGFLPEANVAGGALRNANARAVIQIVLFLLYLTPVLLVGWLMTRRDDLAACGRIYVASAVVLAAIGWVQLALWYATGSNPIQVSALAAALGGAEQYNRQGAFGFAQLQIYRMNSFAGEPRQLGTTLVLAMLLIQAYALTATRPPMLRLLALWLFLFSAAAATYSTSAAAIWLIGTAVELPAAWLLRIPVRRSGGAMAGAALVVVAVLGLAVAAAETRGIPVVKLIAERTVERLDESGAVEDFDLAILAYLDRHPGDAVTGLGIGDAHLYAAPFLDPIFAVYAENTVFSAKTGYLKLISEIGLIGLGLFLAWYARLAVLAARAVRGDPALAALLPVGAVTLAVYLANSGAANEFWLTAGLLTAASARVACDGAKRGGPGALAKPRNTWSGREDSNLRPLPPEDSALPG